MKADERRWHFFVYRVLAEGISFNYTKAFNNQSELLLFFYCVCGPSKIYSCSTLKARTLSSYLATKYYITWLIVLYTNLEINKKIKTFISILFSEYFRIAFQWKILRSLLFHCILFCEWLQTSFLFLKCFSRVLNNHSRERAVHRDLDSRLKTKKLYRFYTH